MRLRQQRMLSPCGRGTKSEFGGLPLNENTNVYPCSMGSCDSYLSFGLMVYLICLRTWCWRETAKLHEVPRMYFWYIWRAWNSRKRDGSCERASGFSGTLPVFLLEASWGSCRVVSSGISCLPFDAIRRALMTDVGKHVILTMKFMSCDDAYGSCTVARLGPLTATF